jgi:hypothetical protein
MRPRLVTRIATVATTAGAVIALLAPLRAARAQGVAAEPAACVRATAPDSAASPSPSSPGARASAARRADTTRATLRILASAAANEVRFVGSPKVCVRLTGDARLDSVHVLARRNITSPVVSNTTYRNVYVAVEIVGRLNAECIAGRVTGQRGGAAGDSTGASRCAALDARGGAGAGPP